MLGTVGVCGAGTSPLITLYHQSPVCDRTESQGLVQARTASRLGTSELEIHSLQMMRFCDLHQSTDAVTAEVVQVSDQDAFWVPSFGGFSGTTNWKDVLVWIQNSLEGFHISTMQGRKEGMRKLGKDRQDHHNMSAHTGQKAQSFKDLGVLSKRKLLIRYERLTGRRRGLTLSELLSYRNSLIVQ